MSSTSIKLLNKLFFGRTIISIVFLVFLASINVLAADLHTSTVSGSYTSKEALNKSKPFRRNEEIEKLHQSMMNSQKAASASQAVKVAPNVVLLESTVSVTQDYFGDIKILGELKNEGNSDASFGKITYTFKDASNMVIGTDFTYVYGSSKRLALSKLVTDTVLSPGEVGGFSLYTTVPHGQVNSMYYRITFDTYDTYSLEGNIELYGDLNKQEDYFGYLDLLGELVNTGSVTAYFIKFAPTMKNERGRVIDVDFSYVNGETIALESGITTDTALSPGSVGSFEVLTLTPYQEVSTITYKINWDEQAGNSNGSDSYYNAGYTYSDEASASGGCFIATLFPNNP